MDQASESVKTVTAMKARQNFGELLDEVFYKGELVIIERAGKPRAALVPLSMVQAPRKEQKRQPKKRQS